MSRLLLSLMDVSLEPFSLNIIYSEMRNDYVECCCGSATVNYLLYCCATCVTVSNIKLIYVICTVPDFFFLILTKL